MTSPFPLDQPRRRVVRIGVIGLLIIACLGLALWQGFSARRETNSDPELDQATVTGNLNDAGGVLPTPHDGAAEPDANASSDNAQSTIDSYLALEARVIRVIKNPYDESSLYVVGDNLRAGSFCGLIGDGDCYFFLESRSEPAERTYIARLADRVMTTRTNDSPVDGIDDSSMFAFVNANTVEFTTAFSDAGYAESHTYILDLLKREIVEIAGKYRQPDTTTSD